MKWLLPATPRHLQVATTHPGGWRRWVRYPRLYEAWLILTGRMTLHVAWQRGYDRHIEDESVRRANGGAA